MKSSNADERLKKMLTALPNREETVNLFELLQRLQDAGITFEQLAKSTIIKLEGDIKAPKVINLFVSKLNDNTTQNSLSNRAKSFDLTESEIVELANMASEHIYLGVMDEGLLSYRGVLAILKRYEEIKEKQQSK